MRYHVALRKVVTFEVDVDAANPDDAIDAALLQADGAPVDWDISFCGPIAGTALSDPEGAEFKILD